MKHPHLIERNAGDSPRATVEWKLKRHYFFLKKKLTKFDNVRIIKSSIVNLPHVVLKFQEIEGFSHFSAILI